MNLVLTLESLLDAFAAYNTAIFPLQWIAYALGLLATVFVLIRKTYADRVIFAVLSFLWLWTGVHFCLFYFAPIYTPAYLFGGFFILQGLLFLANVFKPRLSFGFVSNGYTIVGLIFIAYAMLGYPLVGRLIGHIYPRALPFGLAPCPLTIFTFGLYLLTTRKVTWSFLLIPLFWALCGVVPVSIGILEDIGLILSGLLGTALLLIRNRTTQR